MFFQSPGGVPPGQAVDMCIIALQEIFFPNHPPPPQKLNGHPLADTDIAQHTPYQGFSVTGYIRTRNWREADRGGL